MKRHAIFLAALAMSLTVFQGPAQAQGDGDLAAQREATRQLRRDMRQFEWEQGYFRRGDRLPSDRHRQYRVDDWRGHRLSAPPRGYHWVQIGGEYALVANNSGVIRHFHPNR